MKDRCTYTHLGAVHMHACLRIPGLSCRESGSQTATAYLETREAKRAYTMSTIAAAVQKLQNHADGLVNSGR